MRTLVAAVAENGVIGRDGAMPWSLPADLAQFKERTLGHVLVMGSRTFDSIGRPLPGRTTVVVSRQRRSFGDGVPVLPDVEQALARATRIDPEVFVVGGAYVYADALARDLVDALVISRVHAAPEGDTFFPDVDWDAWAQTSSVAHDGFTLQTYRRAPEH